MKREARIEARIRNNRLWHVVHGRHRSVAEFCREYSLDQIAVGRLLNLKGNPIDTRFGRPHGYTKLAMRLAEIGGMAEEDMFPPAMYGRSSTSGVAEVSLSALTAKDRKLLTYQETGAEDDELRNVIASVLATLPAIEQTVLRMRFGLCGTPEHKPNAIGAAMGASTSRIRLIEKRALRRIRDSDRARLLDDWRPRVGKVTTT